MGTDASNVVSESESLWPRFKRRIKRKGKNQASMPKYAVEISPKSEGSVSIVSISRDGELIPVVLSPARKSIYNDQQPSKKKKKPPGFDAADIKEKSHDAADISMKSGESEVHSEELASKQISKKEEKVGGRKSNLWSWVPICKAFLFPTVPDLHHNCRAELKVSQGSLGGHAKYTEAPAIEQCKAQEFRPENELPDLIKAPIDQASKSASISAEVDSEGGQQLASIGFDRKVSSHARMPNSPFKLQGIESTGSLSSSLQLSLSSLTPSAFGRTLPDFDGNAMESAAMQLPSPSFFSQLPPLTPGDHVWANTPNAVGSQRPEIFRPPWSANWGDPIPSYNRILPMPSPAHQFTIPSPLPSPGDLGVPLSPNGLFSPLPALFPSPTTFFPMGATA